MVYALFDRNEFLVQTLDVDLTFHVFLWGWWNWMSCHIFLGIHEVWMIRIWLHQHKFVFLNRFRFTVDSWLRIPDGTAIAVWISAKPVRIGSRQIKNCWLRQDAHSNLDSFLSIWYSGLKLFRDFILRFWYFILKCWCSIAYFFHYYQRLVSTFL